MKWGHGGPLCYTGRLMKRGLDRGWWRPKGTTKAQWDFMVGDEDRENMWTYGAL